MWHILCFFIAVKSVENNYYWEGKHMSRVGNKMQEKFMSMKFRGKEIFKPLNTGRIDEHVSCVREYVANIFFYTKNGIRIRYAVHPKSRSRMIPMLPMTVMMKVMIQNKMQRAYCSQR